MIQKRQKDFNGFIQNKAVLPGEGAALLCAFFYWNIYGKTSTSFAKNIIVAILIVLFFHIVNLAALCDSACHIIPNKYCWTILVLTLLACPIMTGISVWERVIGGGVISVPMFGLAICRKGSFGGGDIKLMGACGTFLGVKRICGSFAFAVILAASYGMILLFKGKPKNTEIPMGVFLQAGMVLEVLRFAWKMWK